MKKTILLIAGFMISAALAGAQSSYDAGVTAHPDLQPAGTASDYKAVQSGSADLQVQAGDVNGDGVSAGVRVQTGGVNGDGASQRVLPTVNKKTITVTTDAEAAINNSHSNIKNLSVAADGWGAGISAQRVQDFEKNTEAKAEGDENISEVDIAPDHVDVGYQHSAKLFGIFPMTMNLHAVVDKDGNLKINAPWYRFLTTSDFGAFSAAVQADFQAQQGSLKTFKVQDLLQRQAQYFNSLTNILKTRHDASQQAASPTK